MNQHEAPVGTLAYLGHPDNHRLIMKTDDGHWYVVNPMPVMSVEDEEFRGGWHPLAVEPRWQLNGDGTATDTAHAGEPTWWVVTGDQSNHGFADGDVIRRATAEEQTQRGLTEYPDRFIGAHDTDHLWAVGPADRRPLQVGDPDNLSHLAHYNYCYAEDVAVTGWVCTWAAGHTGDHMAGDENEVLAVWPQ